MFRRLFRVVLHYGALSLPLCFLAVFFFYPLGTILARGFDWDALRASFDAADVARLLWFTFWQAALSTLLTLAVGLPGAYVLARYRFRGKVLLKALATIPFVLPAIIVSTAFLSYLGPNGVVNALLARLLRLDAPPLDLEQTLFIILLAHVFYNYSVVLRVVGGVWEHLDPGPEEAARTLGASRLRAWLEITLPQLAPAVLAAGLLVFTFCFTSFGVVMILGGPRFATIEVEIYRQAAHLLNLPLAAALSVLQLLLTFLLMGGYTALQRRTARPLDVRSRQAAQRAPKSRGARMAIALNVLVIALLPVAPLAALAARSLTLDGTLTLGYYGALLRDPGRSYFYVRPLVAARNSLLFAVVTTCLSLALGTLGAYLLAGQERWQRRAAAWLDPLLVLPLGASAVTLGLGYLLAFSRPPLNLIVSPLLVPVAHSLIAFPFVLRTVLPALRAIRPAMREAAATLGASPLRVWWAVDLPLLARPLLAGAVYAFTISLGEFGATLLLARREYATIPVAIYRYLSNPGLMNLGQALAMSTLLMGMCALSFVLIERLRVGEIGSF